MYIKVIATVKYFEIEGITDPMVGNFLLTKNQEILNGLVYNREFLSRVGLNKMNSILSNYNLYYQGDSEHIEFLKGLTDQNQITYVISKFFKATIGSLWFVKNNNCYLDDCYVQFDNKEVFSTNGDPILTDNIGEIEPTVFNLEELTSFIRYTLVLIKLTKINDAHLSKDTAFRLKHSVVPNPLYHVPYDHDRILRALLFIPMARSNGFSIIKLTFYMAAFEALFSSSKEEIRKSISKRASVFLAGEQKQIQENERIIKKAYDIRSSYIHGDTVKMKPEDIITLCQVIDTMTRQIFLKIIDEHFDRAIFKLSKTKNDVAKFNEYFDDLVVKDQVNTNT